MQPGDEITFGRKILPPEFEFVFEAPPPPEVPVPLSTDEGVGDQEKRIIDLQNELETERKQSRAVHNELVCCICQDWLVHSSTIECSHTYCWSCIDTWLRRKKFECPVCRHAVTQEPVRSSALDSIVQKSVDQMDLKQKEDYAERIRTAKLKLEKAGKLHENLERSVNNALENGQSFFHMDKTWSRKEKDVFHRGVKDYTGNSRETYCKLTGLTVQWIHGASPDKLKRALLNLQLKLSRASSEVAIRQRLLMFLRYG